MKNKKSVIEFILTYGWIILAAIVLICILAHFGVFNNQYTIYKNECTNVTNNIKYTLNDFHVIDCPKQFLETVCYDNNNNVIIDLKCLKTNIKCLSPYDNSNYLILETDDNYGANFVILARDTLKILPEFYGYSIYGDYNLDFPTKENKIEEVCNKVEVNEKESLCYDYNVGEVRLCKSWEYESISNLEKIKLSKEWLDENCECQKYYNYWANADTLISSKEEYENLSNFYCNECDNCIHGCKELKSIKCQKYKCFENYFIEVSK